MNASNDSRQHCVANCCDEETILTILREYAEINISQMFYRRWERVELYMGIVLGILSFFLNLIFAMGCRSLLKREKLPWRRYFIILNTSCLNIVNSVCLAIFSAFRLYVISNNSLTKYQDYFNVLINCTDALFICFAIDVSFTSFFHLTAVKMPLFYGISMQKRNMVLMIIGEWFLICIIVGVMVREALPWGSREGWTHAYHSVMFSSCIVCVSLSLASLYTIIRIVLKHKQPVVSRFVKILKSHGVTFLMFSIVFICELCIFSASVHYFTYVAIHQSSYRYDSCPGLARYIRYSLIIQKRYAPYLYVLRLTIGVILLQHPLVCIYANSDLLAYVKHCYSRSKRQRRRQQKLEETILLRQKSIKFAEQRKVPTYV